MLSRTLSRFDLPSVGTVRYLSVAFVGLIAVVAPVFGALVTTNIYVVTTDDPVTEDQYVTSMSAVVDGVIDGDLTIFTGNLTINGEITGSVQVMSSGTVTVTESGRIGGALRGVAVNASVSGEVGGDVFVTAASVVIEESGVVTGDAMAFGGVARIEGTVQRDVRGRTFRTVVTGTVGGDIDVATQRFEVGPNATIDGDILYRSPSDASISPEADIVGTITRLPAQSNFVYGLILSLANLIGLLAFIVSGIVILLVARGTGSRATGAMITNPVRSLLYGLAAVIAAPVLVVLLGATLVGLPIAVMIAMLMAISIVLGPVPAVAALGNRVLMRRGGLIGGFVVGAVLWRLGIWLIPVVGGVLYLVALVWGVGAWINGAVASRRQDELPMTLLPATLIPAAGVPSDWTPPLAPRAEPLDDAPQDRGPRAEPAGATVASQATESREAEAGPQGASVDDRVEGDPMDRSPKDLEPPGDGESGDDPAPADVDVEPDDDGPSDSWGLPSR